MVQFIFFIFFLIKLYIVRFILYINPARYAEFKLVRYNITDAETAHRRCSRFEPLHRYIDIFLTYWSDIKTLTTSEPQLLHGALPAFQKYNEEQFAAVKLPNASQKV